MNLSTLLPSLVRTYVPLVVSWIAGWLITLGVNVTSDDQAKLASAFGAAVAALYYLAARLLERKFAWATLLLGSPVQPAAYLPAALAPDKALTEVDAAGYGRHAAAVDPPVSP